MLTATQKNEFVDYISELSLELYDAEQWEYTQAVDEMLGCTDTYDMKTKVYETAFERRPELFNTMNYISTEGGTHLWVRPGYEPQ